MSRYFTEFFVDEPLVELTGPEAHTRRVYVEEAAVPGLPLHYRHVTGGVVDRVVYPGQAHAPDPGLISAHRAAYPGVPLWAFSSHESGPASSSFWTWQYDGRGTWIRTVYEEAALDLRSARSTYHDAAGAVVQTIERRFDEHGAQLVAISRDAAGRVVHEDD